VRLREQGKQARNVAIKLRFADFETINRSQRLPEAASSDDVIYNTTARLLGRALGNKSRLVRLVGVEVSNLLVEGKQLGLFDYQRQKQERRDQAIDRIRRKYGFESVQTGGTLALKQLFDGH
jgi:DNA polymerase-4